MKINFTREQYEVLLKAVYIGIGVVKSGEEADQSGTDFEDLEGYLLSFAKYFGLERYADYDREEKRYYPSRDLEEDESVIEYIHRYDDFTFWDKLVYNLSERDMIQKHGKDAVAEMSEDECLEKGKVFSQRYEKEFEKNGLMNLVIPSANKGVRKS